MRSSTVKFRRAGACAVVDGAAVAACVAVATGGSAGAVSAWPGFAAPVGGVSAGPLSTWFGRAGCAPGRRVAGGGTLTESGWVLGTTGALWAASGGALGGALPGGGVSMASDADGGAVGAAVSAVALGGGTGGGGTRAVACAEADPETNFTANMAPATAAVTTSAATPSTTREPLRTGAGVCVVTARATDSCGSCERGNGVSRGEMALGFVA